MKRLCTRTWAGTALLCAGLAGALACPPAAGAQTPAGAGRPPGWPRTLPAAGTSLPAAPATAAVDATARTAGGPRTLVALGDSITFGYNLGDNQQPSAQAFPFLVAKHEGWQAVDLGVPGWTSADLLRALSTPRFQSALRQASVVTVDIGSNDLLQASQNLLAQALANAAQGHPEKPVVVTAADRQRWQAALTGFAHNLPQIVAAIRRQTAAPLVLFNLYDPFPDGTGLHLITESVTAAANAVILETAAQAGCPFVDAYAAINHRQNTLIRSQVLDIHPTAAGQQALADALVEVLGQPLWHQPAWFAVSPQGVAVRSQPQARARAVAVLHGNQGDVVTAVQGDWLQVAAGPNLSGWVPKASVTLLLRPWPDITFRTQMRTATRCTPWGLVMDGVWYAPVSALAKAAGMVARWDNLHREVNVEASAAAPAGAVPPAPAPAPAAGTTIRADGPAGRIPVRTAGILVRISGEPVHLSAEPVMAAGQVYVPAASFWQALGGTFKAEPRALQLLSPSGS
ncbi:MAG: SGNH/GDSL hydrolase family protein [Alicyclobacillaceae bacterium]|nr:SGNH/GDSL hydrolase family protein [Alicyclobacillaceae bacterium]